MLKGFIEIRKDMPRVKNLKPETKVCDTVCDTTTCDTTKCETKVSPSVENPDPLNPKERKKREPSAYIVFCNQERVKVKAEQPDLKFTEVGKELGKRWKALTEEQKASYKK